MVKSGEYRRAGTTQTHALARVEFVERPERAGRGGAASSIRGDSRATPGPYEEGVARASPRDEGAVSYEVGLINGRARVVRNRAKRTRECAPKETWPRSLGSLSIP